MRDALLGRHTKHLDLDFVLPAGAVETAQAIARHYRAGFVLLDAERQIARVVFERATADFAQQVGPSLEIDLHRRDFTVNAIAYNPHTDDLIDPLDGYSDLKQGVLRMVSPDNLQEDPLRLLRAYRQAAQLGFCLDAPTQAAIQRFAPLLGRIAAERVQAELSYLFSTSRGTPWLLTAWQDGLLSTWFPDITPAGRQQLAALDQAAEKLTELRPEFGIELHRWIRDKSNSLAGDHPLAKAILPDHRRNWLSVAKLTSLLSNDPDLARTNLLKLKYSRVEIQASLTLLKLLPKFQGKSCVGLSRRDQYFLFQEAGVVFPSLVVTAVATGTLSEDLLPLIDRFLTPDDPIAHPTPLLSGQMLMTTFQLPPGPRIGKLLTAIQLAQAEGEISTIDEALQWVKRQLISPASDLKG